MNNNNNISARMQEIDGLLAQSAARIRDAENNGAYDQVAQERSYRQQLLSEYRELEARANQPVQEEPVVEQPTVDPSARMQEIDGLLAQSAARIRDAENAGAYDQVAQERSYRQQLLSEYRELEARANQPVQEEPVVEQPTVDPSARMQEIDGLLAQSAARIRDAENNGAYDQVAQERSYRQQLLSEYRELEARANQPVQEEPVVEQPTVDPSARMQEIDGLLAQSAARIRDAENAGAYDQVAQERSYRQQLLSEYRELESKVNTQQPAQEEPVVEQPTVDPSARMQEIDGLLAQSAARIRDAENAGAYDQVAQERSYRQQLLSEYRELESKVNTQQPAQEEPVVEQPTVDPSARMQEIDGLLAQSAARIRDAENAGAYDQVAQERSYRQQLLSEYRELEARANQPVQEEPAVEQPTVDPSARMQEIDGLLAQSAARIRDAENAGAYDQVAQERSYRQQLLSEYRELESKVNTQQPAQEEPVVEQPTVDPSARMQEIDGLLAQSAARIRDAENNGAYDQVAQERSYRQGLLAEYRELEARANQPVQEEPAVEQPTVDPSARMQEIDRLLAQSAARIRDAENNGAYDQVAQERSYRQGLLAEYRELEARANANQAPVAEPAVEQPTVDPQTRMQEIDRLLAKSAERIRDAENNGAYDQVAQERSYRQQLLAEYRELESKLQPKEQPQPKPVQDSNDPKEVDVDKAEKNEEGPKLSVDAIPDSLEDLKKKRVKLAEQYFEKLKDSKDANVTDTDLIQQIIDTDRSIKKLLDKQNKKPEEVKEEPVVEDDIEEVEEVENKRKPKFRRFKKFITGVKNFVMAIKDKVVLLYDKFKNRNVEEEIEADDIEIVDDELEEEKVASAEEPKTETPEEIKSETPTEEVKEEPKVEVPKEVTEAPKVETSEETKSEVVDELDFDLGEPVYNSEKGTIKIGDETFDVRSKKKEVDELKAERDEYREKYRQELLKNAELAKRMHELLSEKHAMGTPEEGKGSMGM